jgi:hypothetical protein
MDVSLSACKFTDSFDQKKSLEGPKKIGANAVCAKTSSSGPPLLVKALSTEQ